MACTDNAMFMESSPDVKQEFEDDVYLDDKVLVSKTIINIDSTELDKCTRGDDTKLDLISTEIKLELSPSNITDNHTIMDTDIKEEFLSFDLNYYNTLIDDNIKVENDIVGGIKIEFNNKQLFCNNCNEYYEDYCTKCGMLICILNGNGLNNKERKEIPADVLEIKEGLFGDTGIFALKTIPKDVKFGPFTGLSTSESSCRLKGGKFVVGNDKSESLNWMQYVNCARSVCEQNLYAFQCENNLYYSSICEIQAGVELLVYFGEEYEESLKNGMEIDFIPRIEVVTKDVFACTYCCLGFSLKVHLVEHKTICPNGTKGNLEELVQCPFCKIYLEKEEYLECHEIYCCKGNAKHCVLPALVNHVVEEEIRSSLTNKRRKFKLTQLKYIGDIGVKCWKCKFQTNSKYSLKSHVKTKHLKEYGYNCMECEFKTNRKTNFKMHVKTNHLKENDFNCQECDFKANDEKHLQIHIKTKHLKEYDFKCMACEYKTNIKSHLKLHVKSKHLKEFDYNCTECAYKTNYKPKLETHVKTKHLKEYDYNCLECEYKTNDKTNLLKHMKIKHLKESDFKCVECEFETSTNSHLRLHIKTKHLKENDFNCLDCEYKTNRKAEFEAHVKTKHLKEYDYNCMECEYKTNIKSHLKLHIRSKHLKEYDYNCVECEYKTNTKLNLQRHIKTKHLKEYDFNCMECEYKTNAKANFKMHVKAKHR